MVGATFWRNLEEVVKPRGDALRDGYRALACVVRRQLEQIQVLALSNLRRAVGLISSILSVAVVVVSV